MLFGISTLLLPCALLYSSTAAPFLSEKKRLSERQLAVAESPSLNIGQISPQVKPAVRAGYRDRQTLRVLVRAEGEA